MSLKRFPLTLELRSLSELRVLGVRVWEWSAVSEWWSMCALSNQSNSAQCRASISLICPLLFISNLALSLTSEFMVQRLGTRPPSCLSQFSLTFFINVIIWIWIQKFWYDFVLVTASCSGSDAAWSERPVDWWLVRSAQFLAFLGVESDNLCWKKSSFNAPWADRFSCH